MQRGNYYLFSCVVECLTNSCRRRRAVQLPFKPNYRPIERRPPTDGQLLGYLCVSLCLCMSVYDCSSIYHTSIQPSVIRLSVCVALCLSICLYVCKFACERVLCRER